MLLFPLQPCHAYNDLFYMILGTSWDSLLVNKTQRDITHSLFRDWLSTGQIQTMSRSWGLLEEYMTRTGNKELLPLKHTMHFF